MIRPSVRPSTADVADHYDALDRFYRTMWGEHVHHGLWRTGKESVDEAVEQLMRHVVRDLTLTPGLALCDVGSGYGGTSRFLAEQFDARVIGLTVSRIQFERAVQLNCGSINPQFRLQNWESNDLGSASLDGVVSIECLSHVENKETFFQQIHRVLRAGRRAVVTAWLSKSEPSERETRRLLEPICREGRLAGMGTADEYIAMLESAGLTLIRFEDLSDQVARTWTICAQRALAKLLTSPDAWRFLWTHRSSHAAFLFTIWRIRQAYRTGAMRYGLFVMEKA